MNETEAFFRHSHAFRQHTIAGRLDDARESLDELFAVWLYATKPAIQNRCADILQLNGWADEMDRACREATI